MQLQARFGLNLRRKRKEKGMTQQELAERVGVGTVTINRYENGNQVPRQAKIDELAEALGCAATDLYAAPATSPISESQNVDSIADVADLLARLRDLPPAHKRLVLALIYKDPAYLEAQDEGAVKAALALVKAL